MAGREGSVDELKWSIARQIPHLRRYAMALTRDRDQADDLVQDCLERALRKRRLWRRQGSLRSWLFRMLYRLYIDKGRARRRQQAAMESEMPEQVDSYPAEQERRLECRHVAEALDRLPDEQRAVVLLVALEGMAYDEVAETLDVPIGTVRSRLSRARQALREARATSTSHPFLRRVK